MITEKERKHAARIVALDRAFGHLPTDRNGKAVRDLLDLSIPLAHLVDAGLVTGIDRESAYAMHERAVADVESYCIRALSHVLTEPELEPSTIIEWADEADRVGLELTAGLALVVSVVRGAKGRVAC